MQAPKKKIERVRLYDEELPEPEHQYTGFAQDKRTVGLLDQTLNKIEERFVHYYTSSCMYNPTKAAIRAGYDPAKARFIAHQLLQDDRITEARRNVELARLKRTQIDGDYVAGYMFTLATADPTELVQVITPCCRYCYGTNFLYQRTHGEFEEDFEAHNQRPAIRQGVKKPPFDEKGGSGYDSHLPPNDSCPNCFGRGDEKHPLVLARDTRYLSPSARLLFAGAKQTKGGGVEIVMRDQSSAINLIQKLAEGVLDRRREKPADLTSMSIEELRTVVEQGNELGLGEDDFIEAEDVEVEE